MLLGIPFLLSLTAQIYCLTKPLRAFYRLVSRSRKQQTGACIDEELYHELADDRSAGIADPDLRSSMTDMSLVVVSALYLAYGLLFFFVMLNMVKVAGYVTDRLALSQEMTASFAKLILMTVNCVSFTWRAAYQDGHRCSC
ncbi:hypothetical protein LTR53_014704 [Teratosphaeriaceae sp. CCFEE 6253]|nr:hypothetical protein LTR53_014704 [Teratosphaeriaceae sp. CCFEE 6253]